MTTTYRIYTLSDPRDNTPKYIGRTSLALRVRMYSHTSHIKDNTPKITWIKELMALGLVPVIEEVEAFEGSYKDSVYWERYWMNQFSNWGFPLVNCSPKECGGYSTPTVNTKLTNGRIVYQYDKKGNFIAEHPSCEEAARVLGLYATNIGKVCWGKRTSTGGYVFSYEKKEVVEITSRFWFYPVEQYTLKGEYLATWPNATQAGLALGVNPYGIQGAVRGRLKTSAGYCWKQQGL